MLATIRFLTEPFQAPYMQRALLTVLLLGVLAGVVGVVVQLRRLTFMSDALTHTVFPGVAVAFVTGHSLLLGALVAGVLSAALLTLATRSTRIDDEAFLALLLATFFSVGVVVVSRQESFTSDLTALLFGRVLTITSREIVETTIIAVVALVALFLLRKELLLRAFDETAATALGYPVVRLDLFVNVIVALVVVASVRAVGTTLVVALVVTPAAVARLLCSSLRSMLVVSVVVAALAGWLGLVVSFDASVHHDVRLAAGPTIVVVLTAAFVVVAVAQAIRRAATRPRPAARGQVAAHGQVTP
jgi:manganese/iron transport system permease protein